MSFTPFFIMRGAIPAGIPAKNPLHGGCRIDRFGCPETQIAPYKLQGRQDFRNGNAFAVIKRFGMYVNGMLRRSLETGSPLPQAFLLKRVANTARMEKN